MDAGWLDDEEREGVATYAIARARMEYAGPIDPWAMAHLLGVRVELLRAPGLEGQACDGAPPTVWIRQRGGERATAWRLAHELAHLAAIWCRAHHPHDEAGVDDVAARILVPTRWVRWAARRGLDRERMVARCALVARATAEKRIRAALSDSAGYPMA